MQVTVAGILFGLSVVLLKTIFNQTTFIDAFFWSRMGNVVAALSLLFFPSIRTHLFTISKKTSHKTGFLIIGNRILGGLSFLSVLYAIKLGSASIVNALSSLQFVFIFILIFLFRHKVPELYHHEFRKGHVLHKVLAMCFIIVGFFILFA
jgi:drug/metabolite transporter (DMT)-like permease